ncbi:hypothetical protein IGI04_026378 [Brassica rapa subsp. trilocularis]|uniref:Secreted protein n=1 Tax=Brassica rapa subsp. trilocularis TaxID=1813537 RepID=A0ABQ7KYF9_BRACM|nr:hypothetical protein IGI04_026378 [Brassica rapa subsp. trilocularis]
MVAAAEVMVMVAETASLAEVENEETEIMVMVVAVTDFVYGAVQALHRFKNGARRSTNSVIISTGAVAKRLSFAGSGEGADGFWNGGSRHVLYATAPLRSLGTSLWWLSAAETR